MLENVDGYLDYSTIILRVYLAVFIVKVRWGRMVICKIIDHVENYPLKIRCVFFGLTISPLSTAKVLIDAAAMFAQSQWSVATVCPRP